MGWEKRGNGWYYYRKRRAGRQVLSEYVGGGKRGEIAASLDAATREAREAHEERQRKERQTIIKIEEAGSAVGEAIRDVATAWLVAAGYHKHKGEWRRRRGR